LVDLGSPVKDLQIGMQEWGNLLGE